MSEGGRGQVRYTFRTTKGLAHFGVTGHHPMSFAAKQLLREALDQVPDDATVEDVMERLYFLAKVARGLDAADRGDVVPHDEIEREFLAGE